jgi:dsDNA-binding SOS-regulon protein
MGLEAGKMRVKNKFFVLYLKKTLVLLKKERIKENSMFLSQIKDKISIIVSLNHKQPDPP